MTRRWAEFRRFPDRPSAEELVGFRLAEGVPAEIEAPQLIPGIEGYFVVCVLPELLHRARWVAPQSQYSEAELDFLATGKLDAQN